MNWHEIFFALARARSVNKRKIACEINYRVGKNRIKLRPQINNLELSNFSTSNFHELFVVSYLPSEKKISITIIQQL